MDARLELDIRKGYSEFNSQFEGLSIWIEALLEQLTFHDPLIYSFDVRIKTIESLLKKVTALMDNKESFACFNDVRDRIKDIVGARILVYVPDALRKLHALLMAMDSDRFNMKEIKIHYKEGRKTKVIEDIINTSIELLKPPNTEPNKNGYVGVHYILEPIIKDKFYEQSPLKLFERFELQARTVMHHAWSEIQHTVIYKTDKPDYSEGLPDRFSDLADIISMCDEKLGDLSIEPARFTQTSRPETPPTKFVKIIGDVQKVVTEFETTKRPEGERYEIAQKFLEKHERELAKLSEVSTENMDANLELGELLLRGAHYEKAYRLYLKCLAITERDGWVLLRLAETCDRLGKTDAALEYINRLGEILKKETENKGGRDDVLYHGCAYLAWKYNLFDLAVLCEEQSIKLTAVDDTNELLKRSCNLIYYKTEQIEAKYATAWGQIEQSLVELSPTVQRVENMMDKEAFRSHQYDTLSWYYALRAESENEIGKKQQACKHIKLAAESIEQCFVQWNKYESAEYDVDNSWRIHSIKIKQLKERIEPC